MERIKKITSQLSVDDVKQLDLKGIQDRYGDAKEDAVVIDGVNHVAFVSSDMARTVWFWGEILGLRLTKTIALPDGGQHFFLDGGRGCSIAYFWFPNAPTQKPGVASIDIESAIRGNFSTAHGSVNHVAFNVPGDKLRSYRRKIMETGYFASPILYHSDVDPSGYSPSKDEHTVWESFYFVGPDGEYLELTSQAPREFTPRNDIRHVPKTDADIPK